MTKSHIVQKLWTIDFQEVHEKLLCLIKQCRTIIRLIIRDHFLFKHVEMCALVSGITKK